VWGRNFERWHQRQEQLQQEAERSSGAGATCGEAKAVLDIFPRVVLNTGGTVVSQILTIIFGVAMWRRAGAKADARDVARNHRSVLRSRTTRR
jgi:hypothetical protein